MAIRRTIPRRGPLNSKDFNEAQSEITELNNEVRERLDRTDQQLDRRRLDDALGRGAGMGSWASAKRDQLLKDAYGLNAALADGTTMQKRFGFFSADYVHYIVDQGGSDEGYQVLRRLRLDTRYGQVTLPYNGIKSLFWTPASSEAGDVVLPEVSVSIEDLSAQTADEVQVNDERNAFNADSLDPFLIRAAYPLDADVEEARFNLNVVVPQEIARTANCLTIEPAPEMRTSIVGVKYSDSALIGTADIPGLPTINRNKPLYDVPPQRFYFEPVDFLSIQVQMATKHFVYEDGRKVFYLGLRELGLFEVSLDETWSHTGPGVFTNNGMLLKLELPIVPGVSPDSVTFDEIVGLKTAPDKSLGTTSTSLGTLKGVRVQIYDDDALTNRIYDSLGGSDITPGSPVSVGAGKTHVWVSVELDRNNALGLIPVLTGLLIDYTVQV